LFGVAEELLGIEPAMPQPAAALDEAA